MFLRSQVEVHFGYFFLPKAEVLSLHESEAAQSCPGPLSFENPRLARCLCSMPDTHMGGRLSDLGAQLVGVGEVTPSCCCLSRLGSERFPLAPDPGHVRGSRLPTRVEQTHFCAASLCLPPCLQLGQLELLLLVIRKKKKKSLFLSLWMELSVLLLTWLRERQRLFCLLDA